MEQEAVLRPKISILLPAPGGFDTVRPAVRAWEMQTRRDQLEIMVLCPTAEQEVELPDGQVILEIGARDLHEARAWAATRAAGDWVMLAEDHCLPDPDWTERMLEHMEEGWDAIAPALRPGNRDTMWAEGSFLLGYGEWMEPVERGPIGVLCGWNVLIRTELMKERRDLARDLILGSFLTRDLALEGRRFFLESRAGMRHFDPPGGFRQMKLVYIVGLGFGAIRTSAWPAIGRLLYPFASPAVAALHSRRALRQYLRAGRGAGLRPRSLLASFALSVGWAAGEAVGAVRGLAAVTHRIRETEIKPVSAAAVARSDREEENRKGHDGNTQ